MPDPCETHKRIRRGIFAFAALLLGLLVAARLAGMDEALLKVLAAAAGLLVVMLLITYRLMAGALDEGRNAEGSAESGTKEP